MRVRCRAAAIVVCVSCLTGFSAKETIVTNRAAGAFDVKIFKYTVGGREK